MQDGGAVGGLAVGSGVLEVEGLAADHAASVLGREELLAPLEVGGVGAARREPPVRLVERHPLAVLGGLTLAGRERRQALVVESDAVAGAVFGQALAKLFGRDARPATASAIRGGAPGIASAGRRRRGCGGGSRTGSRRSAGTSGHAAVRYQAVRIIVK